MTDEETTGERIAELIGCWFIENDVLNVEDYDRILNFVEMDLS